MKSAFCPVIRNNSPPARRQHIAKVCCFPIGTRLNFRQGRKPRPITRQPVFPTKPEVRCFPFGSRSPALTGAGNPRPSSEARPPLARAGNSPLFGTRRLPFGSPDKAGKPFDTPPGQLFFLVRFADFSCARSRIPAILKPLFNPDRRRLYEKIWLNLCSRVRKRPKKSNLSKGLAHAS